MAHALDTCAQCGQTDDHPKHHYAMPGGEVVTHHFDCLPHTIIQDITHVSEHQFDPNEQRFRVVARTEIPKDELPEAQAFVLRARDQALKGKHGDDLRAYILKNGPQAKVES